MARFPPKRNEFDAGLALRLRRMKVTSSPEYVAVRADVVRRVFAEVEGASVEEMRCLGGFTKVIQRVIREVTAEEPEVDLGFFGMAHPIREALQEEVDKIRLDVQERISRGSGR